jgi:hypothetical protein
VDRPDAMQGQTKDQTKDQIKDQMKDQMKDRMRDTAPWLTRSLAALASVVVCGAALANGGHGHGHVRAAGGYSSSSARHASPSHGATSRRDFSRSGRESRGYGASSGRSFSPGRSFAWSATPSAPRATESLSTGRRYGWPGYTHPGVPSGSVSSSYRAPAGTGHGLGALPGSHPRPGFSTTTPDFGVRPGFTTRPDVPSRAGFAGRPAITTHPGASGRTGFGTRPGFNDRPGFQGGGARHRSHWNGGYWHGRFWPRVIYRPSFVSFWPVLPALYSTFWFSGVPYYYVDDAYYTWSPERYGYVVTDPPPAVDEAASDAESDDTGASSGSDSVYVYPRHGQSEQQTSNDRYECHQWAVSQTGFDPTTANGDAQPPGSAADYRRALFACLDARGYSAK